MVVWSLASDDDGHAALIDRCRSSSQSSVGIDHTPRDEAVFLECQSGRSTDYVRHSPTTPPLVVTLLESECVGSLKPRCRRHRPSSSLIVVVLPMHRAYATPCCCFLLVLCPNEVGCSSAGKKRKRKFSGRENLRLASCFGCYFGVCCRVKAKSQEDGGGGARHGNR